MFAALVVTAATAAGASPASCPASPPEPERPPGPGPASEVRWGGAGATAPGVRVTLPWVLLQLLPSPELAAGRGGARFGMRWQVTPLLYSFGTDPRLSRFRVLVAEPLVRTAGSVELFVSPEYLALDGGLGERFGYRVGVRSTFPLLERGDALSVSVGGGYARFPAGQSATYQLGLYTLFGVLGLEQSLLPGLREARFIGTLNVRVF